MNNQDILITETREVADFEAWLSGQNVVAIDTETTGLDPYGAGGNAPDRICGVSLYGGPDGPGYYLSYRHHEGGNLPTRHLSDMLARISRRVIEGDLILKTWNGKFDVHMMHADGFELPRTGVLDVLLAAHLMNENEKTFALKPLSDKYLGDTSSLDESDLKVKVEERYGPQGAKAWKGLMWKLPATDVAAYAISDVRLTWDMDELYAVPLEEWGLTDLYHELSDYSLLLARMEVRGVKLDTDEIYRHMSRSGPAFEVVRDRLVERGREIIYAAPDPAIIGHGPTVSKVWANEHLLRDDVEAFSIRDKKLKKGLPLFNPGSPSQLKWVFGWDETDKAFLESLTPDFPHYDVVQDLLDYRVLSKMNGTYYDAYLSLIDHDAMLRPNYNIIGTVTGRLSCSRPNIQNVPRYTETRPVKDVFIPSQPDRVFLEVDYAQAELRIAAHYAQERALIKVLKEGGDPHGLTAERMGVPRHVGKTLNFAVIYGAGARALMALLHCTQQEAYDYLNGYFDLYPGFKRLSIATQNMAERQGYVRLESGRYRRYWNPSTGERYMDKKYGHTVAVEPRKAMNGLIQGTASEMLRVGLQRLDRAIVERRLSADILFQVHDSVLVEVQATHLNDLLPMVRNCLTSFDFDPPPDIDAKVGTRWGQLEKIEI